MEKCLDVNVRLVYDVGMVEYRTRDGHIVHLGDTVYSMNGDGPFVLVAAEGAGEGWVWAVSPDDEELRLHAPEDITSYYNVVRRVEI